jgi:hypothetical protein
MKHNLFPAIIIAAAIIGLGFIFRGIAIDASKNQVEATFAQLEEMTTKKDENGKTRWARITDGIKDGVVNSVKSGFNNGDKEKLAIFEKLEVKEIKIVPGQNKAQEKAIGLVKNNSDKALSNLQFNVTFRNEAGELLDVKGDFMSRLAGIIKPGEERGFEVNRNLGEFNAPPEELAKNKAASAKVEISDFQIVDVSGQ